MTTTPSIAQIGTRHDPHAQARAARSRPLLLHSLAEFREVFELLFAHHTISTVVEIGVESGRVSTIYTDLGATSVFCIEPSPTEKLRESLAGHPQLHLVEDVSPTVLAKLPIADLYVIDGDHNYATVRAELGWITQHAPDAVVVLHDLLWPWSRRDLYYDAQALAVDQRHPDSADGPTIWHDELTPAGFVGAGAFTCAKTAGGNANGVLTAVEDALADSADTDWTLALVPAVFGLGVLARDTTAAPMLEALRPLSDSRLLAALENNRIALYTRVLQMQSEASADQLEKAELVEKVAHQHREIEHLTSQLAEAGKLGCGAPGEYAPINQVAAALRATRQPRAALRILARAVWRRTARLLRSDRRRQSPR